MKKHLLVFVLLISTVFVACAHGRKIIKKKSATKISTPASVQGLTSVKMRRSACFGRCPEYTITISANGIAEFNGIRNVQPIGVYQKNVGAEKAQALLQSFMNNRADTCSALYVARISDLPGLTYTLTKGGKQQTIGNANFGPRYLVDLSEEMDELGKVDETWKKLRDLPDGN